MNTHCSEILDNYFYGILLQSQPHCDNDSETSVESNTSDSGRGGSESDIHSSGGLSQCQELGQRKFQKHKR